MHASCESPWHSLAKHCILDTCFLLTVPFRGMLLTPQGGPRCLAPTAPDTCISDGVFHIPMPCFHGALPVYPQVLPHSSRLLHGAARAPTTLPHPTLPWSIELSSGVSPSLLPHCSSHLQRTLPCSAWKTQAERYRWRVHLLAPSALCGSPVFAQRVGQVASVTVALPS